MRIEADYIEILDISPTALDCGAILLNANDGMFGFSRIDIPTASMGWAFADPFSDQIIEVALLHEIRGTVVVSTTLWY